MTVRTLSQIATAPSPPAATDTLIGVAGGTTDYQFSLNQIGQGLVISGLSRNILTANRNYYVATTGSDSNDGSLANPWATLQHAMDFIATFIDLGGFQIFVNIGAGTFVGVIMKATVGGGILQFNGAGSNLTTIVDEPSRNNCIHGLQKVDSVIAFDKVTFQKTSLSGFIYEQDTPFITLAFGAYSPTGGGFGLGDVQFNQGAANSLGIVNTPGGPSLTYTTTGTFVITASAIFTTFLIDLCGVMEIFGGFTVVGNPTIQVAFVEVTDNALIYTGNQTGGNFAGAATGTRFLCTDGGNINLAGSGLTFFPGSTDGLVDPSSGYDGSAVPITVAELNTNFPAASFSGSKMFVKDATQGIVAGLGNIVAGTGGNSVPVYSDAANWIIG